MPLESDLQRVFYRHFFARYDFVAPNIHLDWEFGEMDLLCLRPSGYIDEVEIKLSVKDFYRDFKKKIKIIDEEFAGHYEKYKDVLKHDALKTGVPHCNYFSFLVTEEIVEKCDIPEYAGLYVYYINNAGFGRIKTIKSPKLLHKRKLNDKLKYSAAKKMAGRYWGIRKKIEGNK